MPVYTIGLPDGREAEIEAPEGATEEQVLDYVKQQWEAGAFKVSETPTAEAPAAEPPAQPTTKDFSSGLLGLAETAATMGTGFLSSVGGGLAGLATAPFTGTDQAANLVKEIQEGFTYQPRTESGQAILGGISAPLAEIEKGQRFLGDTAQEAGAPPSVATAAYMAPDIIGTLFGLSTFKNMRSGTKLKVNGQPTMDLKRALDKEGISYDLLPPDVKAAIPDVAPASRLTGASLPSTVAKEAKAKAAAAGGTDAGLANILPSGAIDDIAESAIKQGWEPRVITMAKNATPETKGNMLKMLSSMEQNKKGTVLTDRPSQVFGESLNKRISIINKGIDTTIKQLDEIVASDLKNVTMNPRPVLETFKNQLDDWGVRYYFDDKGVFKFDFEGSPVMLDNTAKKTLRDIQAILRMKTEADILSNAPLTGQQYHMLKKTIDNMIDYRKSNVVDSITPQSEKFAKAMRQTVNEELRKVSTSYAEANDYLSNAFSVLDDLNDAVGAKVRFDKFGTPSERKMGIESRKIFSNYANGDSMLQAIKAIDDFARGATQRKDIVPYTGKTSEYIATGLNDDLPTLARFAIDLDKRFGSVAGGDFQGRIEAAMGANRAANAAGATVTGGPAGGATSYAADVVSDVVRKMKGITEDEGYRTMEELLRRR